MFFLSLQMIKTEVKSNLMKEDTGKKSAKLTNPNIKRFKYEVAQEFGLQHRKTNERSGLQNKSKN